MSTETATKAKASRPKTQSVSTAQKKPRVSSRKKKIENTVSQKKYLKVIFASVMVVMLALSLWAYQGVFSTLAIPSSGYKISIEKGSSYSQVIQQLEKEFGAKVVGGSMKPL